MQHRKAASHSVVLSPALLFSEFSVSGLLPLQRLKDDLKSGTFVWELNVYQTQALISLSLGSQ